MESITIKARGPNNKVVVLKDVKLNEIVLEFCEKLSAIFGIRRELIILKSGFPPSRLLMNLGDSVSSLGLKNHDVVTIEEGTDMMLEVEAPKQGQRGTHNILQGNETPTNSSGYSVPIGYNEMWHLRQAIAETKPRQRIVNANGMLLRRTIPDDNSCLFNAVIFSARTGEQDPDKLRSAIASHVYDVSEKFSEAVLGKSIKDYQEWIQKKDSWGGEIELSLLSDYYSMQISVVHIQWQKILDFGTEENYNNVIYLLYDGIHYDSLYWDTFDNSTDWKTTFEKNDMVVKQQALAIAQDAFNSHLFTDTSSFSLKCENCGVQIKGEQEARQHGVATGHANFSEITDHNRL